MGLVILSIHSRDRLYSQFLSMSVASREQWIYFRHYQVLQEPSSGRIFRFKGGLTITCLSGL
jgi:hypothetical protein